MASMMAVIRLLLLNQRHQFVSCADKSSLWKIKGYAGESGTFYLRTIGFPLG
jgi:hypothetical protein